MNDKCGQGWMTNGVKDKWKMWSRINDKCGQVSMTNKWQRIREQTVIAICIVHTEIQDYIEYRREQAHVHTMHTHAHTMHVHVLAK